MFGRVCYPSLEDINEAVDLAIVVVPAKFVVEVIEKASEKVKNLW